MRYLKITILAVIAMSITVAGFTRTGPSQRAKSSSKRVGYLAFWRDNELWTCRLDGSEQRHIVSTSRRQDQGIDMAMSFSRRSGLLAWWGWSGQDRRPLWIWPVSSGKPRIIFTDTESTVGYDSSDLPSFTPDGRSIVFGRGHLGIWQIDVDGRHLRRLTKGFPDDGTCGKTSVSPDGRYIAFEWNRSYELHPDHELYLVNRTTGKIVRTGIKIWDFTWSPKNVLTLNQYHRTGEAEEAVQRQRVVLYDHRTKRITPVTSYGPEPMEGLSVSPDSRKIAYARPSGDASWSVMLADISTRQVSKLAKKPSAKWIKWTRWSPDGSRIFYEVGYAYWQAGDIRCTRPNGRDDRMVIKDADLAGVFER